MAGEIEIARTYWGRSVITDHRSVSPLFPGQFKLSGLHPTTDQLPPQTEELTWQPYPREAAVTVGLSLEEEIVGLLTTPGFINDPYHVDVELHRIPSEGDLDTIVANAGRLTYDHFFPIIKQYPQALSEEECRNPSELLRRLQLNQLEFFNLVQEYYTGYGDEDGDNPTPSTFTTDAFASFLRIFSNPITFRTRFGSEFPLFEKAVYGQQSHVLDILEEIRKKAVRLAKEKQDWQNT